MRNKRYTDRDAAQSRATEEALVLQDVSRLSGAFRVRPRPVGLYVRFAGEAGEIPTLEGKVRHAMGDAIITGLAGEQWPVQRSRFLATYVAVPPTLEGQDGVYEKRPRLLWAARLTQTVLVPLSSGRGSLRGEAGDYLVQTEPGDMWVVASSLFDSTYEPF